MIIGQTVFQGWATARPFLFFDPEAGTLIKNTVSKIDARTRLFYGCPSFFSLANP